METTVALSFGAELRRLREQRGLSLRKLARMIHYDPGHLSRVENDAKPDPRFSATAEQLKKEGIDDFQLHYALQTLAHTANVRTAQR